MRIIPTTIDMMELAHASLIAAEEAGEPLVANRSNWSFHRTLYAAAAMPELLSIIEGIWLRTGPTLAQLYPDARPSYPGRHRHLDVLDGLRTRSPRRHQAGLSGRPDRGRRQSGGEAGKARAGRGVAGGLG